MFRFSLLSTTSAIVSLLLSFTSLEAGENLYPNEKKFVVIIPSYNNKMWFERNLESVLRQNYHNFRVIYTDDNSNDGMSDLLAQYIKDAQAESRVTLVRNQVNRGALFNIYTMAWQCEPDEVLVNLDGDDSLAHENVLAHLNQVYSDPEVWMTYGQFVSYPKYEIGFASQLPDHVIKRNAYRSHPWVTTHLRTYYAWLFHKIERNDLLYDGEFYRAAPDMAIMFPMLEMAGEHSRFIPEVLYIYNMLNPISDFAIRRNLELSMERVIRLKKSYLPLTAPFCERDPSSFKE